MHFSWIPVVTSIIALTQFGDFLNRSVLFHILIYILFSPIVLSPSDRFISFLKTKWLQLFFQCTKRYRRSVSTFLLLVTLCSEQPMISHVYIIKFTESQLENCACVLKHSVFIDFSRSITKAILNSNVLYVHLIQSRSTFVSYTYTNATIQIDKHRICHFI